MDLYHYYDRTIGPFKNLSDLALEEATKIMQSIKQNKPQAFCSKRSENYMEARLYYENILRREFTKKGGRIERMSPHYMIIEQSSWLSSWYENSAFIKIPIEAFDLKTVSFTYGDSHPTFSERVNDGKEYRKKLFTYPEILQIIEKYGLPQVWNNEGQFGPERYIEAHIWSDETINQYINK